MNRSMLALLGAVGLAACGELGGFSGPGSLVVSPILDSIFVGDRLPALRVSYIDPGGNLQPPGPVTWGSSDTSVARIDPVSGAVTGWKRGSALIVAQAQGLSAEALIVVSDTLEVSLLLDTVYVLPGDTLTVPVVVLKSNYPPAATVWFKTSSNRAFTIDSLSGRITALAGGGPFPYIVHADSVADTGAVYVLSLADTTGGKVFYSVRGTVISHVGGPALAVNYVASNGRQAFQLTGTYAPSGSTLQRIKITRPDSVIAAGTYAIDSLNPAEDASSATAPPAICAAPRPWAVWNAQSAGISGYSRRGGTMGVTQVVSVQHGQAISGRFTFTVQRTDLYTDPLGALSITGSFVAPLVSSTTVCR
jgi:hypothetical protein